MVKIWWGVKDVEKLNCLNYILYFLSFLQKELRTHYLQL